MDNMTPTASQDAKTRPIHTIREGDVIGSIWSRETKAQGKPVTYLSLTLERAYQDKDGTRKYTKSFGSENLDKLAQVVDQAREYMKPHAS